VALVKYNGPRYRFRANGKFYYKNPKRQQTIYGDYVSDKILNAPIDPEKKTQTWLQYFQAVGFTVYHILPDVEKRILIEKQKVLAESLKNRSAAERRRDICIVAEIRNLDVLEEFADVYDRDAVMTEIIKERTAAVKKERKALEAQGKVIKEIHSLHLPDKIRAIAEKHKDDADIQEAAEERIRHIDEIRKEIIALIQGGENPDEIRNLLKIWAGDSQVETAGKDRLEALKRMDKK